MISTPKYSHINLHYKLWPTNFKGASIFGDYKLKLLIAMEKTCPLKATDERLGLSYLKSWGDLTLTECKHGFRLVNKIRGGKEGEALTVPMKVIGLYKLTKFFTSIFQNQLKK